MVVVLMGVAGSGKTTVGRLLAAELGWPFYDADDFHSRASVEKMGRGVPLDEADRRPWLEALRELVRGCLERGEDAVLACSALKESYRRLLLAGEGVRLVHLKGDPALIRERLRGRRGHFMPPELLDSQLAALEEPGPRFEVDVTVPAAEVVRTIRARLGL
ncbi:MAG TPA: gluconokinase [Pyrinomonadaceae bacterium]|nr:gluconokinase [Pyrinomonadaceae bacterium]